MSRFVKIFVPVPQEYMGIIIGNKGRNINEIKQETKTRITSRQADESGEGSGFEVSGRNETSVENARLAIRSRMDNATVCIKQPIPQRYVRLLVGKKDTDNFRSIQKACNVKIVWPQFNGREEHVTFDIKGLRSNCERAKEMLMEYQKKWDENAANSISPASCGTQRYSKVIEVPKKYVPMIVGKGRNNIERIETKSKTKIKVPSLHNAEAQAGETVQIEIFGEKENADAAEARIRHCIIVQKERMMRKELGGDTRFVCFVCEHENEMFRLNPEKSSPKLDGFIKGKRHRIETESDDESEEESEVSVNAITEIKEHLLTPLKNLQELLQNSAREEPLMADLWCHFGTVLVSGVDEEKPKNNIDLEDIRLRLPKTIINATLKCDDSDDYWKISFEEGVDQSSFDEDALPKTGDENHDFFDIKLVHTQWRYDFGFQTPLDRNIRMKVWEGLPAGTDEPPVEVKNILKQVSLPDKENIMAWLCHPSTSCVRGEIMTPESQYDCRLKLRAGYRNAEDKCNVICMDEDRVLSEYLSNCTLDKDNHCMKLPDEKENKLPEGFMCTFYREAKENFFSVTVDDESYTVIVLDQKGWDSDSSKKREQQQFGIRVVMDSWSKALLSPQPKWTPEEILDKLEKYMDFLSSFKERFLDS